MTYQDCVLEIGGEIPKQRILNETYDRFLLQASVCFTKDLSGELEFEEMVDGLLKCRGPVSKTDIIAIRLKSSLIVRMMNAVCEKLGIHDVWLAFDAVGLGKHVGRVGVVNWLQSGNSKSFETCEAIRRIMKLHVKHLSPLPHLPWCFRACQINSVVQLICSERSWKMDWCCKMWQNKVPFMPAFLLSRLWMDSCFSRRTKRMLSTWIKLQKKINRIY